jgi:hypothetical protein
VHARGATPPIESIQTGKNAFITSPMTAPSKIPGIHLSSVISPLSLVSNLSNLASNRSISRFVASSASPKASLKASLMASAYFSSKPASCSRRTNL